MSDWQEAKLGEVAKVQTGPFGSQLKNEQYITGGTPVVTVEHINNFRIKDFKYPSVTNEDKQRLSRYLLSKGDIIFTRVGSVDLSAYVQPHQEGWMFSSRMLRVRPDELIDSRFLSYFFQQKSFRDYILNISVGATMPSINTEILKGIPISYPDKQKQKAIASVLSSLDDKIDLLHRQNTTLERMSETLFRQWFVEEAQDSNIAQFVELQSGYAFKSKDFKDNGIHRVLKIKNISGGIIDVKNTDFLDITISNKTDEKFKVMTGDILFAMTGAEIGKLGIVPKTNESLWLNQRVGLLKEKYQGARFLAYLQLNSDFGQDYIENSATGSAQPNISGGLIEQCPFPKVGANQLKECAEILNVYYQKLISNLGQIQTIEKLRDTLLPKLMSGEVRVYL